MIPEQIREAIIYVGLRSRDLVYYRYADELDEGTLGGLCYIVCQVVNALCPDLGFRLARFRTGAHHYFLVSRNHRVLDLTSNAYLPAKYRLRVMVPWPDKMTRKAVTLFNRVKNHIADSE